MARPEDNLQARLDRDLAELKLPEIAKNYRAVLDEAARKGTSMLEVLATLIGLEETARQQRALQRRLRLGADDDAPLFGAVTRLAAQKGFDLLLAALPELIADGAQLALGRPGANMGPEPAVRACRLQEPLFLLRRSRAVARPWRKDPLPGAR